MSNSFSCEVELEKLAEKLHDEAYDLEKAVEILKTLRESENHKDEIKSAKQRARSWMRS